MILLSLLELLFGIIKVLFSWLDLPDMPAEITDVVDTVIQYIVDGLPIIWCFLDKRITLICLGISLAVMNFEKVYDFLMWILAKLPIGINKN